jgi:hypothetical protein
MELNAGAGEMAEFLCALEKTVRRSGRSCHRLRRARDCLFEASTYLIRVRPGDILT